MDQLRAQLLQAQQERDTTQVVATQETQAPAVAEAACITAEAVAQRVGSLFWNSKV
jgi:hypothetical protein